MGYKKTNPGMDRLTKLTDKLNVLSFLTDRTLSSTQIRTASLISFYQGYLTLMII
jgi:hypothetical protein